MKYNSFQLKWIDIGVFFFHSVIQSNVITPFLEKFEGGSGPPDPPSGSAHDDDDNNDDDDDDDAR